MCMHSSSAVQAISQSLHNILASCGLPRIEPRQRLLNIIAANSVPRTAHIVRLRSQHNKPPTDQLPSRATEATPQEPDNHSASLQRNPSAPQANQATPDPNFAPHDDPHPLPPDTISTTDLPGAPPLIALIPPRTLTVPPCCAEAPVSACLLG